ncbi:hypothetical protein GS399_03730 [Pedobacter sp. HMF7647]|uniref:Lipocalin-like domain-containing protein n=1 Tax=Hufsiella arboris TaxID=2695275 RepID=A0A7K1Y6K8_9SPHI|nr:hypothetical protein [Hufsiella arboris]MXV50070.1 hypothetical protein [Hufsiella arboris]
MKYSIKIIFLLLLVNSTKITFGQNNITNETLICGTWKLKSYEEAGVKHLGSANQNESQMIFYADHKFKSIEPGNIENGAWNYNPTTKILTTTDNITKKVAIIKVSKLTSEECVLEFKDPDGILLKVHMIPK